MRSEREQAQEPVWGVNQGENSLNCLHICLHSKRPLSLSPCVCLCSGSIPGQRRLTQPLSSFGSFGPIVPSRQLRFVQGPNHFHFSQLRDNENTEVILTIMTIFHSRCCINKRWPWLQQWSNNLGLNIVFNSTFWPLKQFTHAVIIFRVYPWLLEVAKMGTEHPSNV